MLSSFCVATVTVLRAPVVSERGHERRDWRNPVPPFDIEGCTIQRAGVSREAADRLAHSDADWRLYAPPGSDIKNGDRIVCGQSTYEVMGEPQEVSSPTGALDCLYCELKARSG